jgi:hypothetical protein
LRGPAPVTRPRPLTRPPEASRERPQHCRSCKRTPRRRGNRRVVATRQLLGGPQDVASLIIQGLACRPVWWVIPPRSGQPTSRSARAAGPSRSAPASGAKGHRPPAIVKAAPAKDHAGLGRIHPKDRDDASHRAGQQGRGAAEPPVDPLSDQDLVGGSQSRPPRPHPRPAPGSDHPGGRARPRLAIRHVARPRASAARPAWASPRSCRQHIGPSNPVPSQLRTTAQALSRSQTT